MRPARIFWIIARAIAVKPQVLLLDEPTSALDPISTAHIEKLIDELKEDFTIVIVTHNMQQAARVSDYTAYMYLGDLIEFGDTSTVFTNNRTQAVRLPAEMRFPDSVKKVEVRVSGQERIIAPAESSWDSFFLGAITATEDFMAERASQSQPERESL